jgi:tetratricopeptide (TPR) repeat protein
VGSEPDPETPEGQAWSLLGQAYEEPDRQRRTELARQALALWPDCADGYILLAENAPSRKEALRLYQQAVEAGERGLGPEGFRQAAGHFWLILQTRPYMRAREGLAHALWTAGRRSEAVEHLQAMLVLNPGDNQGLRYTLAGFLLFLGRDEDLARLLEQYPQEGSATWTYTRALLAFRQGGDTPEARGLLAIARRTNKHIPEYLLERKESPGVLPDHYSPGQESEALHYIATFMGSWKDTPGAIAWLRANDPQLRKEKDKIPAPRGPLALVKRWLESKLPQEEDVWQADARPLPNALRIGGEKVRPWLMLVTSRSHDLVLAHFMLLEAPVTAFLWDTVVQAMQNPAAGQPHRPTQLQVHGDEHWHTLRPHFKEVGVDLVEMEELDQLDWAFQEMCEHVLGKPEPGLVEMPGVIPEQVAGFYEAAADFFQQAPWKQVGYESAIQVECTRYQGGPWYGVLMGQLGIAIGLALYEELEDIHRTWEEPTRFRESLRQSVVTSVLFSEEVDLPLADVQAAQRHGWKLARPDAWPLVMHKERGMAHRPPLAWELELMEGCLRTIPALVRQRPQDDPTPLEMTAALGSGELKLVLSWVVEEGA